MEKVYCMNEQSFVQHVLARLRREWYLLVLAAVVVVGVIGFNVRLHAQSPVAYDVLEYESRTLPTLAEITYLQQRHAVFAPLVPTDILVATPEQLQAAPGVLVVLWLMSRWVASPFLLITALQVTGALACVVCAYTALRVGRCTPPWALLGSIAYGIIPARFYWSDAIDQWFVAVPLVAGIAFTVWVRADWWDWQRWHWYHWACLCGIVLACSLFGKAAALTAVLVWVIVAVMQVVVTRQWPQAVVHLGSAFGIWVLVQLQVWWLADAAPARAVDYRGLSVAAMVLPHADHWLPPLATIGTRYASLVIEHTDTYYIGILALAGVGVLVWRAIRALVVQHGTQPPLYDVVLVLALVFIANQRSIAALLVWVQVLPFTAWNHASIWVMFLGMSTALHVAQAWSTARSVKVWLIVSVLVAVVVIDQMPMSMLLPNLKKSVVVATPRRWQDGVLVSQETLPRDVVAIHGLLDVIPGYGRWAAHDARTVVFTLADALPAQLTLYIRAKSDGTQPNRVLPIRLGDQTHTIVLRETMQTYAVSFTQVPATREIVLEVGTSTHRDRGAVFVQSLWADIP